MVALNRARFLCILKAALGSAIPRLVGFGCLTIRTDYDVAPPQARGTKSEQIIHICDMWSTYVLSSFSLLKCINHAVHTHDECAPCGDMQMHRTLIYVACLTFSRREQCSCEVFVRIEAVGARPLFCVAGATPVSKQSVRTHCSALRVLLR